MTTLPQTTAIRLPRQGTQNQLAPQAQALPVMGGGGGVSGAMSGSDVWRIIRNNIWLILFMLALSTVAGYFIHYFLAQRFPRYTSSGLIEVRTVMDDPMHPSRTGDDQTLLLIEQKTQAQYLMSESLLTKVLQNDTSEIRKTEWFKKFGGNIPAAKDDFIENYSVRPIPETRLVMVSFTNRFPTDCRIVVREMGNQHIQDEAVTITNEGEKRSQTLTLLKAKYRAQYQETQARLDRLRSQVSSGGGSALNRVNIKENQLDQLRKEQSTIDLNYKGAVGQLDATKKSLAAGEDPFLVEQAVNQDGLLQQYKLQADQAQQNYDSYRDKLDEKHPTVQQLAKQLERARQKRDDHEAEVRAKARSSVLQQLAQNVATLEGQREQILANIDQVQNELGELTNTMVAYFTAESQQKGNADLLKQVQDRLDIVETEIRDKTEGKVKWFVLPAVPTSRSFPQLKYSMPIAIIVGLLLGLGIAFLREMTDTSVRSPRDIQRVGQMTLLGMIGDENQDPQAAGARLPLVIFDAPHSMTAEQLRQVRTRLQHAASLDTTRSILVTSPSPGDGKTTICCNIAAGLALNGRRILLVDGNFRRPEIHKVFALANEQGFSDVLNGAVSFDEVVQETQVPNLAVMTSGPKPINATEMFESQLLVDFIERALEEFDHVIFDSGPMMVVSESAAMAPRVDGVVTVVRARSNSRGLLTRMRDSLRAVRAEHLGVVLNAVRTQGGGYYASNIKTYYEYQNG